MLIYLRPSAILVRRGNPEKVTGVTDLFQPSYKKLSISKRVFSHYFRVIRPWPVSPPPEMSSRGRWQTTGN